MGHVASPKPLTVTCEIGIESQEHEDYDRVLLFMCRLIFEGDILKMITLTCVRGLSSRKGPTCKRFMGGTFVQTILAQCRYVVMPFRLFGSLVPCYASVA